MQLCELSLHQWLQTRARNGSAVSADEVGELFMQVVKGIEHVHGRGLIHRDVKPQNIFLKWSSGKEHAPTVKLGDFGLAVGIDDDDGGDDGTLGMSSESPSPVSSGLSASTSSSAQLHTTGVGTGTYASPEQLNNSMYDEKADIYSLGMVLFEMLSRFETGMERQKMMREVRAGRLQTDFVHTFPAQSSMILWLTARCPDDRPTAHEVLEAYPRGTGANRGVASHVGKRLAEANRESELLKCENAALREEVAKLKARLAALESVSVENDVASNRN